jgi:hypothetical protein
MKKENNIREDEKIFNVKGDGTIVRSSVIPPTGNFVFISHDARDSKYALLFCKLIEGASQELLKTFCSSRTGDLECGDEWYNRIMSGIDNSVAIVCLLTKNSKRKPWILFEAGIAKGKFPHRKIRGLVIDTSVRHNSPFSNFQLYQCEKDKLINLLNQLIRENTDLKIAVKDVIKIIEKHVNLFLKNVEQEKAKEEK